MKQEIKVVTRPPVVSAPPATARWIVRHWERLLIGAILLVTGLAHGINMFNFPYIENDEGVYTSQAWAILREGQLAPYTYWYDHAPAGWILIAAWALLTGGFHTFGATAASGRVLMLVLNIASSALLYGIARTVSRHAWVATFAVLLFSLPAYSVYFERRVLLDNIATFWVLLSLYLLIAGRFTLTRVWASALTFGIAVLSKENAVFLLPALIILTYWRADRSHRRFAVAGWVTLVGSVVSLYFLMAVIKGELFPTGTLLGGAAPHVSLLGTLSYQASRGKDGGLFALNSAFWSSVRTWGQNEPLLVIGGTICAGLSVLLIKQHRIVGLLGLCSFLLWAFLARGGIVLGFYLIPSIPFLALNVALMLGVLVDYIYAFLTRWQAWGVVRVTATMGISVVTVACLLSLVIGYMSPELSTAEPTHNQATALADANINPLTPWTNKQAIAQAQATQWIEQNVGPNQTVVVDDSYWVDLHATHPHVQWYWKIDLDPAIRDGVLHDDWRNIDYILVNLQIPTEVQQARLTLVQEALAHCVVVARFDTGGWPISICKVMNGRQIAASPSFTLHQADRVSAAKEK